MTSSSSSVASRIDFASRWISTPIRAPGESRNGILRAVKVYTKGGDGGETSLVSGPRVRKDHARIDACGVVDELNASVGVACRELDAAEGGGFLATVQQRLVDVGGELATPDIELRSAKGRGFPRVSDDDVSAIEERIDALEAELEPLRNFVLPGGCRAAAALHVARGVCRRAERRIVALAAEEPVAPVVVRYLNRLSDLLFVMARDANRRAGVAEPIWKGRGE